MIVRWQIVRVTQDSKAVTHFQAFSVFLPIFTRNQQINRGGGQPPPQPQKEMIDELTEFHGRNARDIADQIEAEEAKSPEEAIRNLADMPDPDAPTAELSPAEFADL